MKTRSLVGQTILALLPLTALSDPTATAQAAPTEQRVQANGVDWRVLRWGPRTGKPILLLHGFPQDAATWQPIAAALAGEGFNVVAFDQRGCSPDALAKDPQDYNFDIFVADALALADATGLSRFDLVGFGMGGAQAWMLAARYPARVKSLVTLRFPHPAAFAYGIEHEPQQRAAWQALQKQLGARSIEQRAADMLANDAEGLRSFLHKNGLPQPHLDRYVARLRQPGVLAGAMSWEHAVSPAYFGSIPAVHVPTLYLWSKGPALTQTTVEATARFVEADYTVAEIPAVGNFMLETAPEAIVAPLLSFLR